MDVETACNASSSPKWGSNPRPSDPNTVKSKSLKLYRLRFLLAVNAKLKTY